MLNIANFIKNFINPYNLATGRKPNETFFPTQYFYYQNALEGRGELHVLKSNPQFSRTLHENAALVQLSNCYSETIRHRFKLEHASLSHDEILFFEFLKRAHLSITPNLAKPTFDQILNLKSIEIALTVMLLIKSLLHPGTKNTILIDSLSAASSKDILRSIEKMLLEYILNTTDTEKKPEFDHHTPNLLNNQRLFAHENFDLSTFSTSYTETNTSLSESEVFTQLMFTLLPHFKYMTSRFSLYIGLPSHPWNQDQLQAHVEKFEHEIIQFKKTLSGAINIKETRKQRYSNVKGKKLNLDHRKADSINISISLPEIISEDNIEELQRTLWIIPISKIAELYGTNPTTVSKFCDSLGVKRPNAKFWTLVDMGRINPNGLVVSEYARN